MALCLPDLCEVVATAEELLGEWWDSDQYGESVLSESALRFHNGGERSTTRTDRGAADAGGTRPTPRETPR